jgi:hypothetical protein
VLEIEDLDIPPGETLLMNKLGATLTSSRLRSFATLG